MPEEFISDRSFDVFFAVESSIRDKVHNSIMLDLSSSVFPENLSV